MNTHMDNPPLFCLLIFNSLYWQQFWFKYTTCTKYSENTIQINVFISTNIHQSELVQGKQLLRVSWLLSPFNANHDMLKIYVSFWTKVMLKANLHHFVYIMWSSSQEKYNFVRVIDLGSSHNTLRIQYLVTPTQCMNVCSLS